jgi:hypothetical protein
MFVRLSAIIINYLKNGTELLELCTVCFVLPNVTGEWWNFYFVFRTFAVSYVPVECVVKLDKVK